MEDHEEIGIFRTEEEEEEEKTHSSTHVAELSQPLVPLASTLQVVGGKEEGMMSDAEVARSPRDQALSAKAGGGGQVASYMRLIEMLRVHAAAVEAHGDGWMRSLTHHGPIGRLYAERVLQSAPEGSYLFRSRLRDPTQHVLSVYAALFEDEDSFIHHLDVPVSLATASVSEVQRWLAEHVCIEPSYALNVQFPIICCRHDLHSPLTAIMYCDSLTSGGSSSSGANAGLPADSLAMSPSTRVLSSCCSPPHPPRSSVAASLNSGSGACCETPPFPLTSSSGSHTTSRSNSVGPTLSVSSSQSATLSATPLSSSSSASSTPGASSSSSGGGGAWIPCRRSGSTPQEPSGPAVASLKVVSFHVWFNKMLWKERTQALLELLQSHRPDVVCLQEVSTSMLNLLQRNPFVRSEYQLSDSKISNRVGLDSVILSRFPMRQLFRYYLPGTYNRSLLWTELALPNGDSVVVANCHLESRLPDKRTRRLQQLCVIFGFLRKVLPKRSTIVLTGDFNMDDFSPENRLIPRDFADVWTTLRPNEPGFTEDCQLNDMLAKYMAPVIPEVAADGDGPTPPGRLHRARCDRILLYSHDAEWVPESVALVGTQPIGAVPGSNTRAFISGHFGLLSTFRNSFVVG